MEKKKGKANGVDKFIGEKLREYRNALGISQETLATSCGITFQQIQKYENGTNRISASRLYQLAAVMGVSILMFLPDDLDSKDDAVMKSLKRQVKLLTSQIEKIKKICT